MLRQVVQNREAFVGPRRRPCSLRQAWARVASAHASDAETAHKGDRINHLLARRVHPEVGACPGAHQRWVSDEVLRTAACVQGNEILSADVSQLRQRRKRSDEYSPYLTNGGVGVAFCISAPACAQGLSKSSRALGFFKLASSCIKRRKRYPTNRPGPGGSTLQCYTR